MLALALTAALLVMDRLLRNDRRRLLLPAEGPAVPAPDVPVVLAPNVPAVPAPDVLVVPAPEGSKTLLTFGVPPWLLLRWLLWLLLLWLLLAHPSAPDPSNRMDTRGDTGGLMGMVSMRCRLRCAPAS